MITREIGQDITITFIKLEKLTILTEEFELKIFCHW